jgi:hypothetical protein
MDMTPELKKARWNVLWAAQRSQRYHSRRTAFFERWNKTTAFVGIIGGSTVIASLGQYVPGWLASLGAAAIVVMSAIDLVAGTGEMARRHNDLRRRFCELEAEIVSDLAPSEASVAKWQAKRLAIESDEPPTYVALDVQCHNELARAYGPAANMPSHRIPLYKSVTAQIMVWPNT